MINFSQDLANLRVHANILDAQGNPAAVQNPIWASTNEDLARQGGTDNGGTTITLEHGSRNATGMCILTFTCDADLGDGVVSLTHAEDVNVSAGQGASIGFQIQ